MLRVGELDQARHGRHAVARRPQRIPVIDKLVITVPEVRMSPDLKIANVYVMPLGGGDVKPVVDALDRSTRSCCRTELAHKVEL